MNKHIMNTIIPTTIPAPYELPLKRTDAAMPKPRAHQKPSLRLRGCFTGSCGCMTCCRPHALGGCLCTLGDCLCALDGCFCACGGTDCGYDSGGGDTDC